MQTQSPHAFTPPSCWMVNARHAPHTAFQAAPGNVTHNPVAILLKVPWANTLWRCPSVQETCSTTALLNEFHLIFCGMCSTFKVLLLLLLCCRRVATTHDLVHERNLCGPVPAPYRRVVPQCTCQSLTQSINAIDVGQTSEEGLGALLSSFVEGCQYAQNDLILRLRNEAIITHLGYGRHGKYFPLLCTRQVEGIWIPKYGSMAAQRFCPASSFC